ncbi:MAG: bacterial Ig-like domain-containing protein, partial [Clostridia bacterium]|nr:bacterial Ig-like domain-containing protein [Clostridia bacterium]
MKKALSLILAVLMVVSMFAITGIVSASAETESTGYTAFTTNELTWTPRYDAASVDFQFVSKDDDPSVNNGYATVFNTGAPAAGTLGTHTLSTTLDTPIDMTNGYIGFWIKATDFSQLGNFALDISSNGAPNKQAIRFAFGPQAAGRYLINDQWNYVRFIIPTYDINWHIDTREPNPMGYRVGCADTYENPDYTKINYFQFIFNPGSDIEIGINDFAWYPFDNGVNYSTVQNDSVVKNSAYVNNTSKVNISADADLASDAYLGTEGVARKAVLPNVVKAGVVYPKIYANANVPTGETDEYYLDAWVYLGDMSALHIIQLLSLETLFAAYSHPAGGAQSCIETFSYGKLLTEGGTSRCDIDDLTEGTQSAQQGWNHLRIYLKNLDRDYGTNMNHPARYGYENMLITNTIGGMTLYSHHANEGEVVAIADFSIRNAEGEYDQAGYAGDITDATAQKSVDDMLPTLINDETMADMNAAIVNTADLGTGFGGQSATAYAAKFTGARKSGFGVPMKNYAINPDKLAATEYFVDTWLYVDDPAKLSNFSMRFYAPGAYGNEVSTFAEETWVYTTEITTTTDIDGVAAGTQVMQAGWNHIKLSTRRLSLSNNDSNKGNVYGKSVFDYRLQFGGVTFHNNTANAEGPYIAVSELKITDKQGNDDWRTSPAKVVDLRLENAKVDFATGEPFSVGNLKVTAIYDDGSTVEVAADGYTVDSSAVNTTADGFYTVTITHAGVDKSYEVTVASYTSDNVFYPET